MTANKSNALNKAGLLHLVARAERNALLPGEAQILREAIELLDDMTVTLETIARGGDAEIEVIYPTVEVPGDDDAPGRP